jgi:Lhr-like helicase
MVEEGKALADKPHIVISTPGRLADHLNTGTNFSLKKIRFLVIFLEQSLQFYRGKKFAGLHQQVKS